MKEVLAKINKVKKEIGSIQKDGKNPFFNSKYLTLAGLLGAVSDKLTDNGLNLTQTLDYFYDGESHITPVLKTVITDIESGEAIDSRMPLIGATDMQKMASAVTYSRRYSISTMLGIIETDDDGEKAMGRSPEQQKNDYFNGKGGV